MSLTNKKILIMNLQDEISGVRAASLLRPLKQFYPDGTIGLWMRPSVAGLFTDHSMVDEVYSSEPFWEKQGAEKAEDRQRFKQALREIRKNRFDVSIHVGSNWRESFAAWRAGIHERLNFHPRGNNFFITDKFSLRLEPSFPRLEINSQEEKWADAWVAKNSWQKNIILALDPFSGNADQVWPFSSWLDVMRLLINWNKHLRFLIVGAPAEAQLGGGLAGFPRQSFHVVPHGQWAILKAVLSRASLFAGGNTVSAHMASGVEIPVLVLASQLESENDWPTGHAPIRLLKKQSLVEISPEDVFENIRHLLSLRGVEKVHT